MLALVAVLAAALLGMAALTIDIGSAAMQQQRLESFADASAMTALREEARVRFALARDTSVVSDPEGCNGNRGQERQSCIDGLVAAAAVVDAVDDLVLQTQTVSAQNAGEVSLGPRPAVGGPMPCEASNPRCWQTEIVQAIPLLFAQGSTLGFEDGTLRAMMESRDQGDVLAESDLEAAPTLRTQGIPIRARSRVETRPVVRVGAEEIPLTQSDVGALQFIPGRAPFALRLDVWNSLPQGLSGGGLLLEVDNSDGSLARVGESAVGGLAVVGRRLGEREALRAGQVLSGALGWTALTDSRGAYVPLFVVLEGSNQELIVGFGFADVTVDLGSALRVTVTPLGSQLALGNATASPRLWVEGESGTEVVQRIDEVLALRENNGLYLHAPVFQ